MTAFSWTLDARDGNARAGTFTTPHGKLSTPVFAPVGTQATVKSLTPAQVEELGAQMVLANTYHLFLRPGEELVAGLGGLHNFMRWNKPILTDSGGFQVFSLAELNKISEEGVAFRNHLDGSALMMTPESSMQIQEDLGADIAMVFDVCSPYPCDHSQARLNMERTHRWAQRCIAAHTRGDQALFGIVQGGTYPDLRRQAAVLEVPVYILEGRHDINAPTALAQEYYEMLRAPEKEIIWFERSGHTPWVDENERFAKVLADRFLSKINNP